MLQSSAGHGGEELAYYLKAIILQDISIAKVEKTYEKRQYSPYHRPLEASGSLSGSLPCIYTRRNIARSFGYYHRFLNHIGIDETTWL